MTTPLMNILRHLNYSESKIAAVIAAAEGDGIVGKKPRISDVATTLNSVRSLSAEHRADVLRALRRAGHVDDDVNDDSKLFAAASSRASGARHRLSPLQASEVSPQHHRLVGQVMARAKRLGYAMSWDQPVDIDAFDRAVANKDISDRIAVKSAMRQVGLL